MQLTDEQLEQAARELCAFRYTDISKHQWLVKVAKENIEDWLQIQEAVNRAVKE